MNKRNLLFFLAIVAQALILAVVPAQKIYTRATGTTVLLKIRPVDPYSMLSGYYVTLNFEIGQLEAYGESDKSYQSYPAKAVFAILERREDGIWHPVSLSESLPSNLPPNRIALRGESSYSRIRFGIEEFYIPEARREEIDRGIREHPDMTRVEVKVDGQGNAALNRLIIGDRVY